MGKLFKSTLIVGMMTMISRLLGFARDVVIAFSFGAAASTDAFFVAFKIPNFLRRLFAEGAFSQAFVPVLSEYKNKAEKKSLQQFVNDVSGTLGTVLLLVTIVGCVGAPVLIMLFAPGFIQHGGQYDLAVEMLRITFPYLFFISLTAFAGGILNTYGNFTVPALTPVLLNLSLIGAAIWLSPHMAEPITALAWGVFIAGVAQLLFQFPFLIKLKLMPIPKYNRHNEGVKKIAKLMLPALFGVSVTQINLLFDTLIATFLATGSVSWLYFSDRLVEFPLGVFGIALATVILPHLSSRHQQASPGSFSKTLDWGLRWVMVIGFPATTALFILAEPMLVTLFQYKSFVVHDVMMSAQSLRAYSCGLLGFILIKILATGYYARQDTKTPVKIGIIAMLSNMVLNVILVFPLAHAGLALATSISAFINAGLLYRGLVKEKVFQHEPGWWLLLFRIVVSTLLMTGLIDYYIGDINTWFNMDVYSRVGKLGFLVVIGVLSYGLLLLISGLRPHHLKMKYEQ